MEYLQRLEISVRRRSTLERFQRGMVEPTLKAATPGDLSLVLPYRHMVSIVEMLRLDIVAPESLAPHSLVRCRSQVLFLPARTHIRAGDRNQNRFAPATAPASPAA